MVGFLTKSSFRCWSANITCVCLCSDLLNDLFYVFTTCKRRWDAKGQLRQRRHEPSWFATTENRAFYGFQGIPSFMSTLDPATEAV